jgi:hypothetical protein
MNLWMSSNSNQRGLSHSNSIDINVRITPNFQIACSQVVKLNDKESFDLNNVCSIQTDGDEMHKNNGVLDILVRTESSGALVFNDKYVYYKNGENSV